MGMIRYPLPITAAMLADANPSDSFPRYDTPAHWSQGAFGNEEDIATRSEAVIRAADGASVTPYPTRTQAAKAAAMVPVLPIVDDLGKDYGTYANAAGRTGIITPKTPYPDATSPPVVSSFIPTGGGIAGGTAVVISGAGFTGATAVTFGGTAATAVVVVNSNTITCTSPAKAAGAYDVLVTTPKGVSGPGVKFTYT